MFNEIRIPIISASPGTQVPEHGARGIAGFGGVGLALAQAPQKIGIDGTGCVVARAKFCFCHGPLVDQPVQFGRREVRVEAKSGLFVNLGLFAGLDSLLASLRGAAILPDDCGSDGVVVAPIPDEASFALIGEADRCDALAVIGRCGQEFADRCDEAVPNLFTPMLHPARLGVVLFKGLGGLAQNLQLVVDQQHGGASRALVDSEDEVSHAQKKSPNLSLGARRLEIKSSPMPLVEGQAWRSFTRGAARKRTRIIGETGASGRWVARTEPLGRQGGTCGVPGRGHIGHLAPHAVPSNSGLPVWS